MRYSVQSDLKIGQFGFSQQDLVIPVNGMPLSVIRTYSSLNPNAGDFGYSWTYAIQDMNVQFNEYRSDNNVESFSQRTGGSRDISLTLPDGRRTTFTYNLQMESVFGTPNLQTIRQLAVWTPPPGVYDTLTPIVSNRLITLYSTIENTRISYWEADPQMGNMDVYDFPAFILTTKEGVKYLITREDLGSHMTDSAITVHAYGKAHLSRITDRNGNWTEIAASRIDSYNAQGVNTRSVIFQRDSQNRIISVTDPNSQSNGGPAAVTYDYDSSGNLFHVNRLVSNESGHAPVYETTTFLYLNPNYPHYITDIQDPRGLTPLRTVYDSEGRLIGTIDAQGNQIRLTHDIAGHSETVYDRLGNPTIHTYDDRGNVIATVDALGNTVECQYDDNNNLIAEIDALGHSTIYTYDDRGNQLTRRDPLGNVTTLTYDSLGNILTETDPLGYVTENTYDAHGNLLTVKDAMGNITTNTYDDNGNLATSTNALGRTTSYQYDNAGHMIQQTDALGNAATFTYDSNGNKLTQTVNRVNGSEAEAITTQYVYDSENRVVRTVYPDSTSTQTVYNNIGKQAAVIDQSGRQTAFEYDSTGNLVKTTYPDDTTQTSTYDVNGRQLSTTDAAGHVVSFHYDAVGQLIRTTYPDNTFSTTTYDPAGRTIAVTDAKGNTTTYFYDNANRQISIQFADNTAQATEYDASGRMISKTDQTGLQTRYEYDSLGRLIRVTDALENVTSYTYDQIGNQLTQTDANGHTTTFTYDAVGHRIRRTLPLGMFETYQYDSTGQMVQKTDFNGRTTTYSYDIMNRLVQKIPDPSFGAPAISFIYNSLGQRISMNDASGTTTYTYDNRNRLLTKSTPEGTLTYTYDVVGNVRSIRSSHSNGVSVDYSYDVMNRLATVADNLLPDNKVTSYSYDQVGNVQSYIYPNGVQSAYTYNNLNRLTNLTVARSSTLASYTYTLGPAGNRLSVAESAGRRVNYSYDATYKLTGESISGDNNGGNGSISYTYDPVGNRLARSSSVSAISSQGFTYDANDRLSIDGYDANGSTVSSGSDTYTYDFENRLISSTAGGGVRFVYDGDGNRVAKTSGGATIQYLVDDRNLTGYAQVMEEIAGGTVQKSYTYGLARICQNQGGTVSFYGYDGHGNVRVLTDSNGAVTDTYDYDAFGNMIQHVGDTANMFLYSGEQLDSNVGFYFLRARYMNPFNGRFLTLDSYMGDMWLPLSLHKYFYAYNNAINAVDPSGQITYLDVMSIDDLIDAPIFIKSNRVSDKSIIMKSKAKSLLSVVESRAQEWFGRPYEFGAKGDKEPDYAIDCSHFIQKVYKTHECGTANYHLHKDEWERLTALESSKPEDCLLPADIIVWQGKNSKGDYVGHVAIWTGWGGGVALLHANLSYGMVLHTPNYVDQMSQFTVRKYYRYIKAR